MKKILLLAAAAMVAASASAEVFPKAAEVDGEDLTPAGYKFNTYDKEFIGFTNVVGGAKPWNMDANWYRDHFVAEDKTIGDGFINVIGGQYNGNEANNAKLNSATKIIDMGGTCGKVLALNFAGSKFPEAYKGITGNELEIGEATAYPVIMWHFDHTKLLNYLGTQKDGAAYMPLRIRVELNLFCNEPQAVGEYWKAYMNDDQNNVRPADMADNDAADILVNPAEFAWRWCEKDEESPDDDSVWNGNDTETPEWNPTRWLVYEWDINVSGFETEDEVFKSNLKLKNEVPGGNLGSWSVLIRNIQLYVPENENRDYIYKARPRTWNYYTVGAPASVESVTVDADALTYTANGGEVTFSAPAKVYNMAGAMVAEGTTVSLAHGVYVAQAGAQTVKIAVK